MLDPESAPSSGLEEELRDQGFGLVAGIDEVGRGPLAGPVMAAAVILPHELDHPWLAEVRDSKALTAATRDRLSDQIKEASLAWCVGEASSGEIDSIGIVAATRLAMCRAVRRMSTLPDCLVIDALEIPDLDIPQYPVIHGDALCRSIASASIVAKVERDRLMESLDSTYPEFGFVRNKGYGTPEHLAALEFNGPCVIHRKSFAPIREEPIEKPARRVRTSRTKPAPLQDQTPLFDVS